MIRNSSRTRKLRGAQPKAIPCPEILGNGIWIKGLEGTEFEKYLPLNTVTIDNLSGSTIIFYTNQHKDKSIRILKNTSRTLDKTTIGGLTSWKIEEVDGLQISEGEIVVSPSLEAPTGEDIAQTLIRKIPFLGGY